MFAICKQLRTLQYFTKTLKVGVWFCLEIKDDSILNLRSLKQKKLSHHILCLEKGLKFKSSIFIFLHLKEKTPGYTNFRKVVLVAVLFSTQVKLSGADLQLT